MMAPRMELAEQQEAQLLLAKGWTVNAVAKKLGRDHKTIGALLKDPEVVAGIEAMKEELGDAFLGAAHRFVSSITDEDIEKIPADKRMVAAGIAIDKHRLITGQATQNIAVLCATACIQAHQEREEQGSAE